jgi:hypothetical protein
MKTKRDGFYMNITNEDRKIIDMLQSKYAINISQFFKNFIKKTLEDLEKQK